MDASSSASFVRVNCQLASSGWDLCQVQLTPFSLSLWADGRLHSRLGAAHGASVDAVAKGVHGRFIQSVLRDDQRPIEIVLLGTRQNVSTCVLASRRTPLC